MAEAQALPVVGILRPRGQRMPCSTPHTSSPPKSRCSEHKYDNWAKSAPPPGVIHGAQLGLGAAGIASKAGSGESRAGVSLPARNLGAGVSFHKHELPTRRAQGPFLLQTALGQNMGAEQLRSEFLADPHDLCPSSSL